MQYGKSYFAAALAIGSSLLLAGCGGGTSETSGGGSSQSGPYSSGSGQYFPNPWNPFIGSGSQLPPAPTQPSPNGGYGGSGSFASGPDAGQAIVITYISTTSDGVPIKLMEMEILGQPLNMSLNPDGKTWTATDPTTGVTYQITPETGPTGGSVTDVSIQGSNGDAATVPVAPQKAAAIPGRGKRQ